MHIESLQPLTAWMLWNSVGASVLIVLLLTLQRVAGNRVSAKLRSRLWLLVLARLILPPLPEISISNPWAERTTSTPTIAVQDVAFVSATPAVHGTDATFVSTHSAVQTTISLSKLATLIWAVGAVGLLARTLFAILRLRRAVRRLYPITNTHVVALLDDCCSQMNIVSGPKLLAAPEGYAPSLVGVIRPAILLPLALSQQLSLDQLRLIFQHELAHLRRHDVLQNYIVAILSAIHWFNPLMWVARSEIIADRELACDEQVLRLTQGRKTREYGNVLVTLADRLRTPRLSTAGVGMIERNRLTQRRIEMIATFPTRRDYRSVAIAASALLVLGTAATAIRAQSKNEIAPHSVVATPSAAKATVSKTYDVRTLIFEMSDWKSVSGKPAASVSTQPSDETVDRIVGWLHDAVGSDAQLSISKSDGILHATADAETQSHVKYLTEAFQARRSVLTSITAVVWTFPKFPALSAALADKIRLATAPGGSPVEIDAQDRTELLRALNRDQNSTAITAPRVMLFDGQRAQVMATKVSSPGIDLNVRPSVDADLQHLALDFKFNIIGSGANRLEDSVEIDRTLSTTSGHIVLMNADKEPARSGRLRILLLSSTVHHFKK